MEVNLLLQIKEGQCIGVVLVAKRLLNGGSMQPGCLVKRQAIHSVLGDGKLMLVKAFMGDKDHGFVAIDPADQSNIMDGVDRLFCLDEVKKCTPDSFLERVVVLDLTHPLDMSQMRSSRNMLGLLQNPMETLLDIHKFAQSLYPKPIERKTGSNNDLKWKAATPDLLEANKTGKISKALSKLLVKELLVPVNSITQANGYTVFSIYQSKMKIFATGLDACTHDGGVVIYKIFLTKEGKIVIKRQVRVLTHQRLRDVDVQPRSYPVRYSYISNGAQTTPQKTLPKDWKYLTFKERVDLQAKILSNIDDTRKDVEPIEHSDVRVAIIAAFGSVNSTPSMFDKIVGMCGFSPICF